MKSPNRMSDKERNQWEEIQEQAPEWSMKKIKDEIKALQSKQDLDEGEQIRLESLEWWKKHKEDKPDPDEYKNITVVKDKRPGLLEKIWDKLIFVLQKSQYLFWGGGALTLAIGILMKNSTVQLAGILSGIICTLTVYSELSPQQGFFAKTGDVLIFTLMAGIPYFLVMDFIGGISWFRYLTYSGGAMMFLSLIVYFISITKWSWLSTIRTKLQNITISAKTRKEVRARFSNKNETPRARYN